MKVTIHSDGTPQGTVVVGDNGEKIEMVTAISFSIDVRTEVPHVSLEIAMPHLNMRGVHIEEIVHLCQICGKTEVHQCDSIT